MQTWPGSSYPLGATFDGNGTNFALFSEGAERVELCLFGDRGKETRVDLIDVDAYVWHAYLPQRRAPASGTATACTGRVRPGDRRSASIPASCCSTPTPRPSTGQVEWGQPVFGYDFGDPDSLQRRGLRGVHDEGRRRQPVLRLGGRSAAEDAVLRVVHLRGPRQGPDASCIPDIPEEIRGTYSAIAHPAIIEHLKKLGVTAIELMPVHQFVNDSTLQEKGLSNYWGYNTIAFFAPQNTYSSTGERGQQVAGVQGHGAGAARGRHRGDPRRRLQPHRRGQPPRTDALDARHRQRRVLPPRGQGQALLHRLHRHRQQPQRRQPARAAAHHGLAAVLGARDARRRLPLRSRVGARPRVLRRRSPRDLLRARAAGPGGLAGEAHRRALGCRARRLPGRQLPAAVDGVERQVPRHGARLLARRAAGTRRVRLPADRFGRPVRALRPPARRIGQLRHGARRLHAARPRLVQREAQRGQRRGQQATAPTTTAR